MPLTVAEEGALFLPRRPFGNRTEHRIDQDAIEPALQKGQRSIFNDNTSAATKCCGEASPEEIHPVCRSFCCLAAPVQERSSTDGNTAALWCFMPSLHLIIHQGTLFYFLATTTAYGLWIGHWAMLLIQSKDHISLRGNLQICSFSVFFYYSAFA